MTVLMTKFSSTQLILEQCAVAFGVHLSGAVMTPLRVLLWSRANSVVPVPSLVMISRSVGLQLVPRQSGLVGNFVRRRSSLEMASLLPLGTLVFGRLWNRGRQLWICVFRLIPFLSVSPRSVTP